jgi:hypothetical protein
MCNLYSITTNQEAIRRLFADRNDRAGSCRRCRASIPTMPRPSSARPERPIIQAFHIVAGWSSPVARQALNLKITGSNPVHRPEPPTLVTHPGPRMRPATARRSGRQPASGLRHRLLPQIACKPLGWPSSPVAIKLATRNLKLRHTLGVHRRTRPC